MSRYSAYKDSGVAWIGRVPSHWKVCKINRLSAVKRGASPRPIDDPKYFDDEGEFSWVRIADVTASQRYLTETTQKLSELGSSLSVKLYPESFFVSIAGSVGKPMITKIRCCIHDGFVYFPELRIKPEFFYYLFEAGYLFEGLGKLGTQLNLNTDTISSIDIPLPTEQEIDAIVQYLDRQTAKIDTLIALEQRLLQLLAEKRRALITHAVTRGLNPDAPMCNLEVGWLGKIPAHWTVERLKFLTFGIEGGFSPQCYNFPPQEGEWGVLKTGCVNGGIFNSQESKTLPDDIEPPLELEVMSGDILMSRASGSTDLIGSVALVEKQPSARLLLSDKTFRLKLNTQICDDKFFVMIMGSSFMRQQILQIVSGAEGLANNIAQGDIRELLLPFPPLGEQREIVHYLETRISKLDALRTATERTIAFLQERRIALIAAAVTGQIRIAA